MMSCAAGAIYDLGAITDQVALVQITRANLTVLGNGATVRVHTITPQVTSLFNFIQPDRVFIDSLFVNDTGYESIDASIFKGVCAYRLSATSIADGGDVTFSDCDLNGGVAFVICDGEPETKRTKNIRLIGTNTARNTYYGINCQAQGDDVQGSLTVTNVRRAYLGYGNRDVRLHINTHRTDTMVGGSNGHIEIASVTSPGTVQTDVQNINITADCSGDLSGYGAIALFQLQSDTGEASIRSCSVRLKLLSAISRPATSVAFRSYSLAGDEVTGGGAAAGVYDEITLAGDLSFAPILMPATQAHKGRLLLRDGAETAVSAARARIEANFTVG